MGKMKIGWGGVLYIFLSHGLKPMAIGFAVVQTFQGFLLKKMIFKFRRGMPDFIKKFDDNHSDSSTCKKSGEIRNENFAEREK